MARLSQNGWPVVGRDRLDTRPISNGVFFPNGVLSGDVAAVLRYVAERFDAEVEPLKVGWCWGYAEKKIEGSDDEWSNHASGTAIDLNAPNHPQGRRNTFTMAQRAAIQRILVWCNGVIRWGGDYVGTPDEMHFEVVGSPTEVRALAAKVRRAAGAARAYTMHDLVGAVPELRIGDQDQPGKTQWVWRLQRLLGVGDDGIYGPVTAAALRERMTKDPNRSSVDGTKCNLPEWRRLFGMW